MNKLIFLLFNSPLNAADFRHEHWVYFIICVAFQTRKQLLLFYHCPCKHSVYLHNLTNTCMCKQPLTRLPLISPWATLTLPFWVSDKAMLVLDCFSPTKTPAKQSAELTSKAAGQVKKSIFIYFFWHNTLDGKWVFVWIYFTSCLGMVLAFQTNVLYK